MIKFNTIILVLLVAVFNAACTDKKVLNKKIWINNDEKYLMLKNQFDSTLVSHFPNMINSKTHLTISNTNSEKNDVGLFLFEYNLSKNDINDLENRAVSNAMSKYNSKDLCLLIVNKFETKRTKDSLEIVKIKDTQSIDKPCYNKRYPIPNFIDFSIVSERDFWKDESFNIYVIDAKSGNYFKEFDLQPDPQMPKEWQNGYSKGIAVSKEKKIVIYWAIIW